MLSLSPVSPLIIGYLILAERNTNMQLTCHTIAITKEGGACKYRVGEFDKFAYKSLDDGDGCVPRLWTSATAD